MSLEVAADFPCACGEAPLWHPEHERLYWVDVDEGKMYAFDPKARSAERVYRGGVIGGMTLQADGRLLLFMKDGAIGLWSPQSGLELQRAVTAGVEGTRFNDVIADPQGRVFAGTMPSQNQPGRLYRLDPDGSIHCLLERVGQPNGMAFSPDLGYFYLTDTLNRKIQRFAYQQSDGEISQPETLVEIPAGRGQPDGLTVDHQGYLWSAHWDGSCITRYDAGGKQAETIQVQVRHVTSLTFVGQEVYVTSAGGSDRPGSGPQAGALFKMRAQVSAPPEFRSRVNF